jgi:hypothetical protein
MTESTTMSGRGRQNHGSVYHPGPPSFARRPSLQESLHDGQFILTPFIVSISPLAGYYPTQVPILLVRNTHGSRPALTLNLTPLEGYNTIAFHPARVLSRWPRRSHLHIRSVVCHPSDLQRVVCRPRHTVGWNSLTGRGVQKRGPRGLHYEVLGD